MKHTQPEPRVVFLRSEHRTTTSRRWAYVDAQGNLRLDGVDGDIDDPWDEYQLIASTDVPRLAALLGAPPGEDILDVLEQRWTDDESWHFEQILRESDIPVKETNYLGE